MSNRESKLGQLLEMEGLSLDEIMEESLFGASIGVPAICMNECCDFTAEYEPDSEDGWCDECGDNTVKSALILGGMI